jgi:bifunctional non-homologous end joining protein LigD
MKAVSATRLPDDEQAWAYEVKWDGYRLLAFVRDGTVRLQSSNLIDVTAKYPELGGLAASVHADRAVLDGEIVAIGEDGRPSFGLLQRHEVPVRYVVFDVLQVDGQDTTGLPYEQRRELLSKLLEPGPFWRMAEADIGDGQALYDATAALGLEGIIAKRLGSTYQPGRRSAAWRKIKHRRRQEVVIGGWSTGEGNRTGTFGALLVGVYDGDELHFCGSVGTGFDQRTLEELRVVLKGREIDACPFVETPAEIAARSVWRTSVKAAHWVRPELVCEVEFSEWTDDAILRHASFMGLRYDKSPREVVREP